MKKRYMGVIVFCLCLNGMSGRALADELDGIRMAAKNGVCTVVYEGVPEPSVAHAASGYDLPGVDKVEVISLLQRFISLGCSMHAEDSSGISPVNVPILTGEPELLRFMLVNGGDPYAVITRSRPFVNGKNSFELAKLVYRNRKSSNQKEILNILDEYKGGR